MVSVSFVSLEKYELQMRKNFSTFFFIPFFAQKTKCEKNFDAIFERKCSLWNACKQHGTMDPVFGPGSEKWGIKHKKQSKIAFFQNFFLKKTMKPIFFSKIFFRRKCSPGTCATFSGNMVSVSVMGFKKFASQVWKIGTCHEICEKKTSPYGQSRSARAPKTSPYGHLAPLVPQKINANTKAPRFARRLKNATIWASRSARAPKKHRRNCHCATAPSRRPLWESSGVMGSTKVRPSTPIAWGTSNYFRKKNRFLSQKIHNFSDFYSPFSQRSMIIG